VLRVDVLGLGIMAARSDRWYGEAWTRSSLPRQLFLRWIITHHRLPCAQRVALYNQSVVVILWSARHMWRHKVVLFLKARDVVVSGSKFYVSCRPWNIVQLFRTVNLKMDDNRKLL